MDERTARLRGDRNRAAAMYDRQERLQRFLIGRTRDRLCSRARGRVLEETRRVLRTVAREVGFTVLEHGRTGLGLVEHVVARR